MVREMGMGMGKIEARDGEGDGCLVDLIMFKSNGKCGKGFIQL